MTYRKKGGGRRQRELLVLLAEYPRTPLAAWWIAEQRGEDIRRVGKSLNRLARRGEVVRHGTRGRYTWSLTPARSQRAKNGAPAPADRGDLHLERGAI